MSKERESLFPSRIRDRLVAISDRHLADRTLAPGDAEALAELVDAAAEFVATTTAFRQRKESRDGFTRLAYALLGIRDDC